MSHPEGEVSCLESALREADDLLEWLLPLFNIGPLGGFEPAVRSHEARMQARQIEAELRRER